MSRKDFELIARVIRETDSLTTGHKQRLAENFAEKLAETNPRFDKARFVKAATEKGLVI